MTQRARARATQNRGAAQRQGNTRPSATQCCRLDRQLILGIFFDGTGNNMYIDRDKGEETNVARLHELYVSLDGFTESQYKHYIEGPGANEAPRGTIRDYIINGLGWVGGAGGRARLVRAYRWVMDQIARVSANSPKIIDVYGFSRGAALSRSFVNLVNQGIRGYRQASNIRVRFLGIFDTVGSFGIPGDRSEPGQNLYVDAGDASSIYHLVAMDERRYFYPLTTTSYDHGFPGVHADVGGGYAPGYQRKSNHLAFVTLMVMCDLSRGVGVAMGHWSTITQPAGADPVRLRQRAIRYDARRSRGPGDPLSFVADQARFYIRYVHQSHENGWGSNMAESSGRRRFFPAQPRKRLTVPPPRYNWSR